MSDLFELASAATPEPLHSQNALHQARRPRKISQVYQRRAKIPKAVPAVVEPEIDTRIHKTKSLVGKYDNAALIDANLSNAAEFPSLQRQTYMENYCTTAENPASRLLPEYRGLQTSSLMNLRNLPVFGTIGPVLQCTRFLLSRIQNGSLWLAQEIPIHAENIHRLTGLS